MAALANVLLLFHRNPVCIGPCVLTNAGDLPGNLHRRLVGLDAELVVRNLGGDNRLSKLPNHRELIAKVAVESFEPLRQRDDGITIGIGDDVAVVDVHHVGRFDGRVRQIFVGGVERIIDLEGSAATGKNAVDADVALE